MKFSIERDDEPDAFRGKHGKPLELLKVAVAFGGTATTTFSIDCVPRVGDLEVTVATTGQDLDLDGYRVTVDGVLPGEAVAIDGSVLFTALPDGDRTVELTGVRDNCTVSGDNPRAVAV